VGEFVGSSWKGFDDKAWDQSKLKIGEFVGSSWKGFDDKAWDQSKLKIFEVPLYNPGITAAVIENPGTATARVKVTFAPAVGEAADKALAVVYDETSDKALFAQAVRQAGELLVPIAVLGQGDVSKLHAYLVFSRPPARGTGEAGQVSGTAYLKVPAPPGP
jgi:hypothetical protein